MSFQLNAVASELRLSNFLHCVARGQQDEAEILLNKPMEKGNYKNLLLAKETFTDYSGQTFVESINEGALLPAPSPRQDIFREYFYVNFVSVR